MRRGSFTASLSVLAAVLLLAAACASAPPQTTPRAEVADPAELRLVGVVTVEGDTVRFDRPRAGDPPQLRIETPRVEAGEVRATVGRRPWRRPVEDVTTWIHAEPEPRRTLAIAAAVGGVVVASTLAFLLGGGFD